MTLDQLHIGDRFQTILTGRMGTLKEKGLSCAVEWQLQPVKDLSGNGHDLNFPLKKREIISSKTEVVKIEQTD